MLSPLRFSSFFLLVGFNAFVNAARISFQVRTPSTLPSSRQLYSRANAPGVIPIHNTRNAEYISNITLGGREIPVLLDTGSSDLWVTGDVPGTKDLGKAVSVDYAVGTAAGDINTADLQFANFTVKDQAYLLVKDTSSFSLDIKAQGFEGLIGLGPNTGSTILDKIDDDSADSVIHRIFSQTGSDNNYLTMMLDRQGDPSDPFNGTMSINELIPGYENITNMPKLTIDKVHRLTDADQHWQTFTDVDGVIGPDGQPIKVDSIVPKAPDGQLVAVFDSGYTLPQVPRAMSDAIYGRVQGAVYNEDQGVWTVPCDQLINLSFKFGGVEYPVHPLDVSSSDFNMLDATGNPVCVGTFQPITSAFSLLGEYDIILGMGFMRNTYTLMDYGNWLKDGKTRDDPYIQLLSLTDKNAAKQDFFKVRTGGVDNTGNANKAILPADQMKHSPLDPGEKKKLYEAKVLSRWPYIFVGCLAFVLIVIGLITWRCCVRRKRQRAAKERKAASMGINTSGQHPPTSYAQFDAPNSATPMKDLGGGYRYENDPYSYGVKGSVV
ncbi:aspartic peptidase A1 [Panus rudis PR-1116 ss-1]|nr:aspartic peptidase A1 [Panus rudis PR-1116 ss-1]